MKIIWKLFDWCGFRNNCFSNFKNWWTQPQTFFFDSFQSSKASIFESILLTSTILSSILFRFNRRNIGRSSPSAVIPDGWCLFWKRSRMHQWWKKLQSGHGSRCKILLFHLQRQPPKVFYKYAQENTSVFQEHYFKEHWQAAASAFS